jgi:hypothetical protein
VGRAGRRLARDGTGAWTLHRHGVLYKYSYEGSMYTYYLLVSSDGNIVPGCPRARRTWTWLLWNTHPDHIDEDEGVKNKTWLGLGQYACMTHVRAAQVPTARDAVNVAPAGRS